MMTPATSHDFDEESESEAQLPPAFDMFAELAPIDADEDDGTVVEVIRYRGARVLGVGRVRIGESYRTPFYGRALVEYRTELGAVVHLDGRMDELLPGAIRDLTVDGASYLVRFAPMAEPARALGFDFRKAVPGWAIAVSLGVHLLVAIVFLIGDALRPEQQEWSGFAQIRVPATPTPVAATTPAPTPEPEKKEKALAKAQKPARKTPGKAEKVPAKQAPAGVLGGLGKMDLKIDSKSPMLAAVSNLDAVRSTNGSSGGFRVSALTGKVPGAPTAGRVGGADGTVEISTLKGKDLAALARGGVGGLAKDKNGGKVRGVVSATPAATVAVQGSLDRSQIAAVVAAHLSEVRRCYEESLVEDPSIAGKVQMEWTIDPSGKVQGVKTKFSSLKSGNVPGCLGTRIRTWTFPKPRGNGFVIVNYPFLFDSVGY